MAKNKLKGRFKKIYEEFTKGLDDYIAKEIVQDEVRSLRRPAENWKSENKPSFKIKRLKSGNYSIYTNSKLFLWIDRGTKPHKIKARKAPYLAIPVSRFYPSESGFNLSANYKPMSYSPQLGESRNLSSKKRYTDEGKNLRFREVQHSGIRARNWTHILFDKFDKRVQKKLKKYMKDAL